jgi:hypothetical protein
MRSLHTFGLTFRVRVSNQRLGIFLPDVASRAMKLPNSSLKVMKFEF